MPRPKKKQQEANGALALPVLPDPTEREREAIARARQNRAARPAPIKLGLQTTPDGRTYNDASHNDGPGWLAYLADTFGSGSSDFAIQQLDLLMKATPADLTPSERTLAVNSMLAGVAGVQPQNETEATLAVQMAATHHLAMTFLGRAQHAQHIPVLESNGNMATKLLKAHAAQVEALAKLRRGGNQTVRVEHVHVHSGGQAIVGNVTQSRGRGVKHESDHQPHAPGRENPEPRRLTAEPVAPLWSENPEREPVPVTSGEWAQEVPDAWWREG